MEEHVFPNERVWMEQVKTDENRWKYIPPIVEELKKKAQEQGLWNLFLPSESGLS